MPANHRTPEGYKRTQPKTWNTRVRSRMHTAVRDGGITWRSLRRQMIRLEAERRLLLMHKNLTYGQRFYSDDGMP